MLSAVNADLVASVVVPTRDRASLLPDCLRSLSLQTARIPFEVIVVDNGSRDDTARVVEGLAQRDGRFRLVREPTPGLSRAKNAGIGSAGGRYCLFVDDDMTVSPGWIAALAETLDRRGGRPTLVGGPILPVPFELGGWPDWLGDPEGDLPCLYRGDEERVLLEGESLWGGNMAAERDLFDQIGRFDEDIGHIALERGTYEDLELVERIHRHGGVVVYQPQAIAYHRTAPAFVTPRHVLAVAFNRGANDFLRSETGAYYERALRVPRDAIRATLALAVLLPALAVSSLTFRLSHAARTFGLARRYAWGAGWCLSAATTRGTASSKAAVRRMTLLVRRVALALTPR